MKNLRVVVQGVGPPEDGHPVLEAVERVLEEVPEDGVGQGAGRPRPKTLEVERGEGRGEGGHGGEDGVKGGHGKTAQEGQGEIEEAVAEGGAWAGGPEVFGDRDRKDGGEVEGEWTGSRAEPLPG